MIDTELLHELKRIVGAGRVSTGRAGAEVYSYDASLAVGLPDVAVLPGDTEEIAAVVRAATRARVPYVPRGFGTNLSGGSIAAGGGLVIELSRLNRILDIRPEGRYAVVQSGVTNLELQNALAPLGMFYAPDPASQKVATLGGNVGENSGGPHCLKYGVTSNHILGMTVVLPGGDVLKTGGAALDPPGYDLRGVLVGSEGTLGIITELIVRILPSPESVITLLAIYDDNADAAQSVSAIIAAGIVPATLEMMDATIIRAVEDSKPCGYPRDAAAVLIAEVDGPATGLAAQAERIRDLCLASRCREVRRAKDAAERNLLWAGRRGAFGAIARLAPNYLVADCTVPRNRLPDALAQVAKIAGEHGLSHGNVFHAGDGNLHPLLLFDSRDSDQVQRVHEAGREIMEACVGLGGTITGEHGIGMEKADAMRLVFSEDDLQWQRRLREAFDPNDLLNPGKILPPATDSQESKAGTLAPGQTAGELVPADPAEACGFVRRAHLDRTGLLPLGNGTRHDFGNYSEREVVPLRSVKLSSVVEYDPANQVIAVGSGMSLGAMQGVLAESGQWLPIRPPGGRQRTVGSLAALAACGPERLRYGAPRDLLLGLKFVSGTGHLVSAGGRVVKNVAGYDVTRLMVGSAGTLGFLTELTFRVSSLPASCVALVASGTFSHCANAAAELLRSKLEPIFVIGVPGNADIKMDDGAWQLVAGFEGFEKTVHFQAESCQTLFEKAALSLEKRCDYPACDGMCTAFFDTLELLPFRLRADLPLDAVAAFVSDRRDLPEETAVVVDFGCGRIIAAMADLTGASWSRFSEAARKAGGHAILEKVPQSFARQQEVFGPPRLDWQLMHRIKAALDPHDIFVPGRLPGQGGNRQEK